MIRWRPTLHGHVRESGPIDPEVDTNMIKRIVLLAAMALTLGLAQPILAGDLPPTVKATLAGDDLVLSFPEGVMPRTVSFTVHGFNVNWRFMRSHRSAFTWTSETQLTVSLAKLHHKGGEHKPTELWVWGHMTCGAALLQKVTVAN